jgi:hypothetical protein
VKKNRNAPAQHRRPVPQLTINTTDGRHLLRARPRGVTRQEGHMTDADIHFYFDPVCPFAWMTSKWGVRMVAAQRDYTVDWRLISLRLINAEIDYDSHFPRGYEEGHASGGCGCCG